MNTKKIVIKGMHCKSCKMLIEDILEDLHVEPVSFDVNAETMEGSLEVETKVDFDKIKSSIEEEGDYQVSEK